MANNLLKTVGLLGTLVFSGCTRSLDFLEGEDKIKLEHCDWRYESCSGRITINVEKKDGTRVVYDGGRNILSGDKPRLGSCRIFNPQNNLGLLIGENNTNAYRNYTNYIRMAESIYKGEVEKVLNDQINEK